MQIYDDILYKILLFPQVNSKFLNQYCYCVATYSRLVNTHFDFKICLEMKLETVKPNRSSIKQQLFQHHCFS